MYGLPPDASLHGHEVDGALRYLAWTTALSLAVMSTIFLIAIARDRASRATARYFVGHDRLNYAVAAVAALALFVGVDLVSLTGSLRHLRTGFWKFPTPEEGDIPPTRVEVTAQQWSWTFRYPGADGVFGTADDAITLDDLRVPVDRPVLLQLRAQDVVHSFYLPNFRMKVDAIPGHVTRLCIRDSREGTFEIEIPLAKAAGATSAEITLFDAQDNAATTRVTW